MMVILKKHMNYSISEPFMGLVFIKKVLLDGALKKFKGSLVKILNYVVLAISLVFKYS